MLSSLSIRDIVLIDKLDLNLDSGLSALTGETGAGKSILLNAIALACGDRADRSLVRHGAKQAQASAIFEPEDDSPVWSLFEDAGLDIEPGDSLILRRTLTTDGRSRAFVNDQPASVGLLRSLGDHLVEIHGQHDGRGLLDPGTHLHLLDSYASHPELLGQVTHAWSDLAAARERLQILQETQARSDSEQAFLEQAVEELDTLKPVSGEESQLAQDRKFYQQAEQALSELEKAGSSLQGSEGMTSNLTSSLRGLENVRDGLGQFGSDADSAEGTSATHHARQALDRAVSALERAVIEFNEAEDALGDAASAFEVEPGALDRIEERLFALRANARKHSVSVDDLASLRDRLADQLDAIENSASRLKEAESVLKAAEADYAKAARDLSRSRERAGKTLAEAVMKELGPLKLDKARFQVSLTNDEDKPGPKGWDKVRFEVSTNPGAPFGALDKIASGGELSRFALALKVALAESVAGKVMIFDEVDQGVGGAVADAVGLRLVALAEANQAIVVTHSPQVAARAGQHWRIEKSADGDRAITTVRELDDQSRREEIARMLSGAEVTDAARAAADELMAI